VSKGWRYRLSVQHNHAVAFCGNCGSEVTGLYCGKCGARIEQRHTEPIPLQESAASSDATIPSSDIAGTELAGSSSELQFSRHDDDVPSHAGPRVWIGGAGVLVVVLLGVLAVSRHWIGPEPAPIAVTVTATVAPSETPPPEEGPDAAGGSSLPDLSAASDTPTDIATDTPSALDTPTDVPTTKSAEELRSEAYATLEQIVADDRSRSPIRGQWVAQLASKSEGIVDTTQKATPFTLPDILDEITSLKQNPVFGSLVRVVHQGDWGRSTAGEKPMWVTFADLNASSRANVVAWCTQHFTERGQALLNICYPRQMFVK
jgi:hypothetical protein